MKTKPSVLCGFSCRSDASPDAGEGVQQVRRRVAPVVQHLVKREDIVVDAVVGEVSVFDAAECHRGLGFSQLLQGQDLHKGKTKKTNKQTHITSLLQS